MLAKRRWYRSTCSKDLQVEDNGKSGNGSMTAICTCRHRSPVWLGYVSVRSSGYSLLGWERRRLSPLDRALSRPIAREVATKTLITQAKPRRKQTKTQLEKIMKNLATWSQRRAKTIKKIAVSLMLSTCLLMAPAAWATWGSFVSTGTATGIGNPSCAPVSTGQVACAVRSSKSAIMVNEFNGTSWGTWKSLAGTVNSDPSCTSDGNGNVFCAATATNGDLQVAVLKGGVWSKRR